MSTRECGLAHDVVVNLLVDYKGKRHVTVDSYFTFIGGVIAPFKTLLEKGIYSTRMLCTNYVGIPLVL